jgi:hypothetical protein
MGFRPLLTESDGKGGYHMRLIFDAPQPTAKVFALMRALVADHIAYGFPSAPEVFPKQAALGEGIEEGRKNGE